MPARRVPVRRASITEAAVYAGTCRRTIYNWGQRGVITLYRVGPKMLQVDLDELDRHIRPVPAAGGSDAA